MLKNERKLAVISVSNFFKVIVVYGNMTDISIEICKSRSSFKFEIFKNFDIKIFVHHRLSNQFSSK